MSTTGEASFANYSANAHISEKISFLTQIHTAWDGTEQRQCLRRRPRRAISYDFSGMDAHQSAYIRSLITRADNTAIEFPLWHAETQTDTDVANKQGAVIVPRRFLWSYRDCGYLMMFTQDMSDTPCHKLRAISADGTLYLDDGTDREYQRGRARIMPVTRAMLSQENGFANETDTITTITLRLDLLEEQHAPEHFPTQFDEFHNEDDRCEAKPLYGLPATYNNAEVFRWTPMYDGAFKSQYTKTMSLVDYDSGIFRVDTRSKDVIETREVTVALIGREMINNFQRFFYRHRGAWKSFWVPTWTEDIQLITDARPGDTALNVKAVYLWRYLANSRRRRKLIVYIHNSSEASKIRGDSITVAQQAALGIPWGDAVPATIDKLQPGWLWVWDVDSKTLTITDEAGHVRHRPAYTWSELGLSAGVLESSQFVYSLGQPTRVDTTEILDVASYSRDKDDTHGILYLETPLARELIARDVWRISFFERVRFGSDDLLTDYETNEIATCTVTLVETDT